jgi:hypothetical protein
MVPGTVTTHEIPLTRALHKRVRAGACERILLILVLIFFAWCIVSISKRFEYGLGGCGPRTAGSQVGSQPMPPCALLVRVAVAFAAAMPGVLSFSIHVARVAPLHRPSLCRSYPSAGRIPVIIPCDMLNSFLAYKPPDEDPWKRAGTGLCNCTVAYVMHDAFLCAREYVKQSHFMTA